MSTDCGKITKDDNACHPSIPKTMKPGEACKQVYDEYDTMSKIIDSMGDWSPAGVLKALGSSNNTNVVQRNAIKNLQETVNNSESYQSCTSDAISTQSNIIDQSECLRIVKDTCAMMGTDDGKLKCLQELKDFGNVSNITQENKNTAIQQCLMNSAMSMLTKQGASIDNTALAMVLQKSSGLLSSNESNIDQCQIIDNTQSVCSYLNSTMCCNNKANSDQSNILKCANATDIKQTNINSSLQSCSLTDTTTLTAEQISALSNSSSAKSDQTSTGTSLMGFLLLLFAPLLLMGGSGLIAAKFATKLLPFLGLIPIIAGVITIIYYVVQPTAKITQTVHDKPLSGSKCVKNNSTGDVSITYKKAYDKCESDVNCVAVDFITSKDGPTTDLDNIWGSAIYYNSTGGICDEDINDSKNKYYTFYKDSGKSIYTLIGGILLIVLGVVYTVIYMMTNKTQAIPDNKPERANVPSTAESKI